MSAPPSVSSGPGWDFAVPPNWPAPPGFDPRLGHQPDPSWPAAPEGWQFWVPSSRPFPVGPPVMPPPSSGAHAAPPAPASTRRRAVAVAAVGLGGVLAVLVVWQLLSALAKPPASPRDGVGSCWTTVDETVFRAVPCASTESRYRVVDVIADPRMCPSTTRTYLDSLVPGSPTRYSCLIPV